MDQKVLYKYFRGETNIEEEKQIVDWVNADAANKQELLKEREFFDMALFSDLGEKKEKTHKEYHILKWGLGVAASIIVILSCGMLWKEYQYYNEIQPLQSVKVPPGQRAQITLADGTVVWLNAQSTLEYDADFGRKNRNVKLDGEAFFEVAHNKEVPFYVNTEMNQICVVGTKFNVCSYSGSNLFEAALVEGTIDIYDANSAKPILRMQKDEFFSAENGKYRRSKMQSTDFLRWKEGLYCFDDAPLKDVFDRLEKYYKVKFVVNNPKVLNYNCTGKFKENDGVEHVLKVIQKDHKFTYRISETGEVIYID